MVVLSVVLYVHRLGFYSDDWALLAALSLSPDRSFLGLVESLYAPHTVMRPVQLLYLSGLYWLFGMNPLGYHLVNAGVMVLTAMLLYLVLRELGQHRLIILAIPLVYALLPHYSTDRFWYAAFQANLSMLLYFSSSYADLRALHPRPLRMWGWKVLSVLCIVGSGLAYEVVLPLFLFNIPVLWFVGRRRTERAPEAQVRRSRLALALLINVVAVFGVAIFKVLLTNRTHSVDPVWRLQWFARLMWDATYVSFWDYGVALPYRALTLVHTYPDLSTLGLGAVLSLLVFAYLYRTGGQVKHPLPARWKMLKLAVLGLVVFFCGYAVFLGSFHVFITPTGIANRVAIASAVGVAVLITAAAGFFSASLPSPCLRRGMFAGLVAVVCFSGFVINNTLAGFWVSAYQQERQILANIFERFPWLPSGTTLLVDGMCPYVGPAVVFESDWDLAGALMLHYRDPTLGADIITRKLRVGADGLATSLYGGERLYPYGEYLYVYDLESRSVHQMSDVTAARHYFEAVNPRLGEHCPPGSAGHGVRVF